VSGVTARFLAAGSGLVTAASASVGRQENWRAYIEQAGKPWHIEGPLRMNPRPEFNKFAY